MVHIGRGILRLTYAGRLGCLWLRPPPRLHRAATTVMVTFGLCGNNTAFKSGGDYVLRLCVEPC